jgi:phosphopantothenoylcysteine decarboxylase/phosphopantothenate--cysteine ligase
MAGGLCDNLLTAVYLSAKCPVYIAPAMDLDMWKHKATQQNIRQLVSYGNILIAPASGELASGLVGEGRMQEPEDIFSFIEQALKKKLPLSGKKALVTAGPTYEAIDPVRFIGNHSSGKMGFAIAQELSALGAEVQLVSGPASLQAPAGISRTDVTSAAEMLAAVKKYAAADIIVMSAAVADYRPVNVAPNKIKKNSPTFDIALEKTTDILAEIGKDKTAKQVLVGFALETDHELENAKLKLEKKNLDMIVLNSLKDSGAGFKGDTNKITIIDRKLNVSTYPLKSKEEVARDICSKILDLI